jgi:carbon storage regulator
MLVISRKLGQGLILGKDIEITVLRVDGDQVRLGIKAPREVPVLRRELLDEVHSDTAQAHVRAAGHPEAAAALRHISQAFRKTKPQA